MMGDDTVDLLCLEVASDRTAPAAVRAAVGEVREINGIRDDAKLLATELVTAAILHGAGPGDTMEFRLSRSNDALLISVHEHGQRASGNPSSDILGAGALGWWIVQRLARRCGSERFDGRRFWAELPFSR
jgi:hypothetical protein